MSLQPTVCFEDLDSLDMGYREINYESSKVFSFSPLFLFFFFTEYYKKFFFLANSSKLTKLSSLGLAI